MLTSEYIKLNGLVINIFIMGSLEESIIDLYQVSENYFNCLIHIKEQLFNIGCVFTDIELIACFKRLGYAVKIRFIPGSKEPISYWVECYMPQRRHGELH